MLEELDEMEKNISENNSDKEDSEKALKNTPPERKEEASDINSESCNINIDFSESYEEEKSQENMEKLRNLDDELDRKTSITEEPQYQNKERVVPGLKKTITPLDILATIAEMESERLKRKESENKQVFKRRPGRPKSVPLELQEYSRTDPQPINITQEQYLQNPYYYKKLKIRPYESKDGEPQKITIHRRKDSEISKDNNERSESSMDKFTDAYIIKKYGDIPESTFSTGWKDGMFVYFCPEEGCNKYFPSTSRAKRHYIIHTEAKPYKCPNPGCDKRFSRKDNMNQHCRMHCKFARD
ncbi:hypothetical protein TUBRATIS_23350 [Tubulinosema ratisbonensis]|uniref:C2H2-type domain-containing protein n=1 Tax=Tubulinosema ratisbonensis TaxID=291195 RepID=A0A437AJ71_9MICR|nr:hypothetical protein TUBRATIS_23350 [Tubulinosema ratisbonensis]